MTKHNFSYLALGDSYTIGESVPLHESFPYQVVQQLRRKGIHIHAPEIIARTGWTSFELAEHLLHTRLEDSYDFVTLLIGVNNQYRGLSITDFEEEFTFLVKKAVHLAGNRYERVMVLSIPDWGVTPFAKDRDAQAIHDQIDQFNAICEKVTTELQIAYTDITTHSRRVGKDSSALAVDQLHYSGATHGEWATAVASWVRMQV